jgi:hypothetical protein
MLSTLLLDKSCANVPQLQTRKPMMLLQLRRPLSRMYFAMPPVQVQRWKAVLADAARAFHVGSRPHTYLVLRGLFSPKQQMAEDPI